MYFLDRKQFKPQLIFLSVLFLPIIISLIIALVFNFEIAFLVILLSLILSYFVIVIIFYRQSTQKKYYLLFHDENIEIIYPNINKGKNILELNFDEIISFEYYSITSIKSWFLLVNYILPQSIFITYVNGNEKCTDMFGYIDLTSAKSIAQHCKKNLIIH